MRQTNNIFVTKLNVPLDVGATLLKILFNNSRLLRFARHTMEMSPAINDTSTGVYNM